MLRKLSAVSSPSRNAANIATQTNTKKEASAFARRLLLYGWPIVVLLALLLTDTTTGNAITSWHNSFCDILFSTTKLFGRAGVAALIAIALWCGGRLAKNTKWQRTGFLIVLSVALSAVFVAIAKPLFGRMEEQTQPHRHLERSDSGSGWVQKTDKRWGRFPSGDTTMAFATGSTLALAFPEVAALFYVVAVLVAIGRVYVGAHLLSDVFAGAWLGWAVARFLALRFAPPPKN